MATVAAIAELPEIETLRRDLDRDVGGKKIKSVEAQSMATLPRYNNRKAFTSQLDGRKMGPVRRRGTVLVIDIGNDEQLVARMGSGYFRRNAAKDPNEPGTQVIVTFTQGGQLRFVDADGEGELFIAPTADLAEQLPELAGLGFDPVDDQMSWTAFGHNLMRRGEARLKALLTDPTFVVGIGPVYSDEILHDALLRGDRAANSLTPQEIRRLFRSLVETMHNAIKYRGTSTAENGWVDLHGASGGYNEYVEVYGRAGERSRNGRGEVQKVRLGGQVHYYAEYQV
jgi:formamidopyrimidine-DNA glycosylase